MYLTQLDLEITATRILADLERNNIAEADLPIWDGAWPPPSAPGGPTMLRVDPDPAMAKIAGLMAREGGPHHLCHMLRLRHDPDDKTDWAFLPGKSCVLLIRLRETKVSN